MNRAQRLMLFFEEEGRRALEQPSAEMRRALQMLAGWETGYVTVRDLHRSVFAAHGPVRPARELAAELEEAGFLERVESPGRPGRPTELYRITLDGWASQQDRGAAEVRDAAG